MKAMAKQRIALECLSYHASAPADEAQRLKVRNATHLVELCSKYIWGVDMLNARNCSKHSLSFPSPNTQSKKCYSIWRKLLQNTSLNISYNMLQNTFKYLIQVPVTAMNTPTLILNLHTKTSTCNLIVCFYNVVQKITVYIV